MEHCFHCRQPIESAVFSRDIGGESRNFCCAGCQAVSELVYADGLQDFYQFRDASLLPAPPLQAKDENFYRLHDRDDVLKRVSQVNADGINTIQLGIEGITCAACVWLLEQHLGKLPGIRSFGLNLSNHRALLTWNQSEIPLSTIFIEMHKLGYRPYPFSESEEEKRIAKEQRTTLMRIGIAGIGMMQSMMLAIPVYFGLLEESGESFLQLFWYVSLVIATPVVFFSASPFFKAARRDLRTRHLTMDVPVSLAIGGAYAASAYVTFFGGKEVYFDAVSMFTFFLLIGRFLEGRARMEASRTRQRLSQSTPSLVTLITPAGDELRMIEDVLTGDVLRLISGEMVPVDGRIMEGEAAINEAALTGEFHPIHKKVGDSVLSGSLIVDGGLVIEAIRPASESNLSVLERLISRAMSEKPKVIARADRMSSLFVGRVLLSALFIAGIWAYIDASQAFAVTLSVLVATCPCALSLATPTALTAATTRLRELGFVVTRAHVIQTLAEAREVFFDKTGTLTRGAYSLVHLENHSNHSTETLLGIASALEQTSTHPVARYFQQHPPKGIACSQQTPGAGVEGTLNQGYYRIGTAEFCGILTDSIERRYPDATAVYLCENNHYVAAFLLGDETRPGSPALIRALNDDLKLSTVILTGDTSDAGRTLAAALGTQDVQTGQKPDDKLARIQSAASIHPVVMVGDGLNDIPAMAGAQLSIAMANASDMTQVEADALLLNPNIEVLISVFKLTRQTDSIIRQNITWAFGYNLAILPLAACGWVSPYMAAIGMSASSLLVVLNALRLSRFKIDRAHSEGI